MPQSSLTAFALADLIEDVRKSTALLLYQRRQTLEITVPPAIRIGGDRTIAERILHYFITNAITYGPVGGLIRIDLDYRGYVPHMHRIRVTDQRIDLLPLDDGMAEQMGTVSVLDEDDGLRVGLSLCRKLAGSMGGTISTYNVPSGGATITLSLPRA
jgi:signal transduction histidine kinase